MKYQLTIAYLYPSEMNIYGDRGNIITLQQRCAWRGIGVKLDEINLGQDYDFHAADIVFGGGGQDKGQEAVAQDLLDRSASLQAAVQAGTPMLVICGLYQLFGHKFVTSGGLELAGIGVFDATTEASAERLIGNVLIESRFGRLVGFENHSGRTKLATDQKSLGQVLKGAGNNGSSDEEGAMTKNAIGTYLHGPVLPKNPALADFLIETATKNKAIGAQLQLLDDGLERQTAEFAAKLPR